MSDDFMKSALDRAIERADRIEVPQEKLKEMKYRSQGERFAAEFLKDPNYALTGELAKFDLEARKYISKAVESILLQNMLLPKRETDIARNEMVFRGLSAIKESQDALRQAQDQLANLSNYYAQAVKQNYEQLKSQVEQMMRQTIMQKTGVPPKAKINVESIPEFQENWHQVSGKLDAEYAKALAQLKQQITSLS